MHWILQVLNATLIVFYFVAHMVLLGPDFVASDSAKYFAHMVAVPFVLWWMRVAVLSLVDHSTAKKPLPRTWLFTALLVAVVLCLFGFVATFRFAIGTFNHPRATSAPYPTDYWLSFSKAQAPDNQSLYVQALEGWRDRNPEKKMEAKRADGSGVRPTSYFWDVGPLGIVGPMLAGLGFSLVGPLLVLAWVSLIGAAKQIIRGHTVFNSLFACGLMLLPFPGLYMLSAQSMWEQRSSAAIPEITILSCILFAGYTVLLVIVWGFLRRNSVVTRITAFVFWFAGILGPIARLVKPDWFLPPFGLFLTAAMVYVIAGAFAVVVFDPPPSGDSPEK